MTTNPPTIDFRKGTPVRSPASWSAFAAVIECAKALLFLYFLNHGLLRADMVAGDDWEANAGRAGVVMVVASSAAIRRRTETEV
jgi:hypothetical protein